MHKMQYGVLGYGDLKYILQCSNLKFCLVKGFPLKMLIEAQKKRKINKYI